MNNKFLLFCTGRLGNITNVVSTYFTVSDGVTLDDIVRCAREHIGQDWPTLARGFKMSKTEIDAIKSDNRDNLVEQIIQFSSCWERQNGGAATAQAFVDCVMKELPHSEVIFHLKKKSYIEKKGNIAFLWASNYQTCLPEFIILYIMILDVIEKSLWNPQQSACMCLSV